jgi:flagellar protein FlbD
VIRISYMGTQERLLNPDLIEYIETVPETMLVMANGHRYMVGESPDTIVERIVEFRLRCGHCAGVAAVSHLSGTPFAESRQ